MKYTLEYTDAILLKGLLCTIQANLLSFLLWLGIFVLSMVFLYTVDPIMAGSMSIGAVLLFLLFVSLYQASVKKMYGKSGKVVYSYSITPKQIEMMIGDALTMKYDLADVRWSKETNLGLYVKHKKMAFIMFYAGESKDAIKTMLTKYGWLKKRSMSAGRIFEIGVLCLLNAFLVGVLVYAPSYLSSF